MAQNYDGVSVYMDTSPDTVNPEDIFIAKISPAAINTEGVMDQPLSQVAWIPRDRLHSNNYNPNHVSPIELELLRRSIMEDGWTQPIVITRSGEIVDGFHRWLVSADPQVTAKTGGLIPVVRLRSAITEAEQMAATIRHNRARGNHAVLKMSDIVTHLMQKYQWTPEEFGKMLGMEDEEVERLSDLRGMPQKTGLDSFNKGWVPEDGYVMSPSEKRDAERALSMARQRLTDDG